MKHGRKRRGQTLTDYAVLVCLLVVVCLGILTVLGRRTADTYVTVNDDLTTTNRDGFGPQRSPTERQKEQRSPRRGWFLDFI